jgi:hypothetical protein
LAFQSQAWHTDDRTGHAIPTPEPGAPGAPDHTARIVAALANPAGPAPEAETVTLVNASPQAIDPAGWSILDREKRRLVLDAGSLAAGDTIRIPLSPPVALGNRGGLITLLDPDGLKVAYTKAQAEREGWSLVLVGSPSSLDAGVGSQPGMFDRPLVRRRRPSGWWRLESTAAARRWGGAECWRRSSAKNPVACCGGGPASRAAAR